jgi:hypothetical protein
MCKFPTKGLTDGQSGFLSKFLGTEEVTVTGTTKYKAEGGGTRTVFVLEPYTRPKKAEPSSPKQTPAPGGKTATVDLSTLRDKVIGTHAVVDYVMGKEKLSLEEIAFVNEYANYGMEKATKLLKGLDEKKMVAFVSREEVQAWKEAEATYQNAQHPRR